MTTSVDADLLLGRNAPHGLPSPPETATAAVSIEPVRLRDLRAVARLQRRAFRKMLAYRLSTLVLLWAWPRATFLVARERGGDAKGGDRIVGCVIGDVQGGKSRVINICVDPDVRRRRIGARLLAAIEAALPHGDMLLMVERSNDPAARLYESAGYRSVGVSPNYYGRSRDGVWMQKPRPTSPPPR